MYVFFYVVIHITVSLRELKILKIPLFLEKASLMALTRWYIEGVLRIIDTMAINRTIPTSHSSSRPYMSLLFFWNLRRMMYHSNMFLYAILLSISCRRFSSSRRRNSSFVSSLSSNGIPPPLSVSPCER